MAFIIRLPNQGGYYSGECRAGAAFTDDVRDAKKFDRRTDALQVCGSFGFSMGDVTEYRPCRDCGGQCAPGWDYCSECFGSPAIDGALSVGLR